MSVCGASWGTTATQWDFCVLPRGHAGNCQDWAGKPPSAPFYHEQPEAQAFISRQHADEQKPSDKKACKKQGLTP